MRYIKQLNYNHFVAQWCLELVDMLHGPGCRPVPARAGVGVAWFVGCLFLFLGLYIFPKLLLQISQNVFGTTGDEGRQCWKIYCCFEARSVPRLYSPLAIPRGRGRGLCVPQSQKIRVVGNRGPITGCMIHGVTEHREYIRISV